MHALCKRMWKRALHEIAVYSLKTRYHDATTAKGMFAKPALWHIVKPRCVPRQPDSPLKWHLRHQARLLFLQQLFEWVALFDALAPRAVDAFLQRSRLLRRQLLVRLSYAPGPSAQAGALLAWTGAAVVTIRPSLDPRMHRAQVVYHAMPLRNVIFDCNTFMFHHLCHP